ncbi:MAG: hypothetical protein E5V24_23710, partial [Mesorhizobium sp.]
MLPRIITCPQMPGRSLRCAGLSAEIPGTALAQPAPTGFAGAGRISRCAMDTLTIKANGISVSVDLTVGHLVDMTV